MSTWTGATSVPPTFLPRLPNPQSTLQLGSLVLVCGLVAGLAEVSRVRSDLGRNAELIKSRARRLTCLDSTITLACLCSLGFSSGSLCTVRCPSRPRTSSVLTPPQSSAKSPDDAPYLQPTIAPRLQYAPNTPL